MEQVSFFRASFPQVVNRRAARWTAIQVSLIATLGACGVFSALFSILLLADFALRSLLGPHASVLVLTGRSIFRFTASRFGIAEEPVSIRPVRFAWLCGILFSLLSAAGALSGITTLTTTSLAILALFSGLEALFGFCAACYLFGWAQRLGWIAPEACVDCERS
jgi:hypothetical protein